MPEAFRLAPIDLDHGSWEFSVTKQVLYVIAENGERARQIVGAELYPKAIIQESQYYENIVFPPSPWCLPNVTSCEPDRSGLPRDGRYIVAENGEQWRR